MARRWGLYTLDDADQDREQAALQFRPEDWGMKRGDDGTDFMFLNMGPNHPSAHGVFRIVVQIDGEEIVDAVPDIGYHHRAAEKMGERQSWHTFIPYTDRIDYLGGVMNNLPYVMALEKLAGIKVPDRVKVVRVMLCELFRIMSHLLFYGTFVQDLGAMSPIFFMFADRQRIYDIIEAICGFRMHPAWFRIGGLSQDLPKGWDRLVREFLDWMPSRLDEYDQLMMKNRTIKMRSKDIGAYTTEEALDWGVTGPGLRATGLEWDYRKAAPIPAMTSSSSTSPRRTTATATTAALCAWRRCARACASSASAWRTCPRASTRRATPRPRRRSSPTTPCTTSRP